MVVAVLERPVGAGDLQTAAGGVVGVPRLARGEDRELAEPRVVGVIVRGIKTPAAAGGELRQRQSTRFLLLMRVDGADDDQRGKDDEDHDEERFHWRLRRWH
jgi:hypothetical protein